MLNLVVLIGRLTRDPEIKYTPSGAAVASFTIAVDRKFKNAKGEKEADFIRIVVWRKLAEICSEQLSKGRLIAVDGRLQVRSYDGQDGQRKSISEVVAEDIRFLDWPKDGQQERASGQRSDTGPGEDIDDLYSDCTLDDMPF
jgi:single-strand DNA-binding protein